MTPPGRVRVGPLTYRLKVGGRRWAEAVRAEDASDLLGVTTNHDSRIAIAPDQPPELERMTVAHELLHALVFVAGCDLEPELEESVVTQLAPLLVDTLRRNPQMVTYLAGAGR